MVKLLTDERVRGLLPPGSQLRARVITVRLKYTRALTLIACNYSAVPRVERKISIHSEPMRPTCICGPFDAYRDPHHQHVLTPNLRDFQHLPDLYEVPSKGTAFRGEFLQEGASAHAVLSSFLDSLISEASNSDGLPAAACKAWKVSITSALTPAVISKLENALPTNFADDCAATRTSIRRAMGMLKSISNHFVITTTDKATGRFAVMCKVWYCKHLVTTLQSDTYVATAGTVVNRVNLIYEKLQTFQIPTDNVI